MQHKQVPVASVKGIDNVEGIVEAIVSVTNIVDHVNDLIEPGAYKVTLRKRNPKVVWSHDTNIPVGKTLRVEELMPGDPRLPRDLAEQNAGGLLVKMQFNLNTTRGRDAFYDVQFYGEEQEWSIGYSVPEGKYRVDDKSGVRYIKQLDLFEYSPVIFGAAPSTRTLSLKDDMDGIEEKASASEVRAGTPVSFAVPKPPDETEYARGIVDRVVRSGEIRLPNQSETLTASSDDPVAVITVYARMEDGAYDKTDRQVIKNVSEVRVVQEFREDEKSIDEIEVKAGKYDDLDFSIPAGVKKQAEIGLEWSKEYGRGGTSVGKNTANYLINNSVAAPEKVRHIARYFPRHAVDLQVASNSQPGAAGYPGAGLIAWKLWGGNEGRRWSAKLVEAMNKRDEEAKGLEIEEKAPGVSASVEKTLREKVADHNEKYGDSPGKRATFSMLAASYRRGIGAYRTNPSSVRPTVSSAEQWAMARVNGLLYALRTGKFRRTPYDTDLLPSAHPLSSRGEKDIYTESPEGEPTRFGRPHRIRTPRRMEEEKPWSIQQDIAGCSGYAVVKEGESTPIPGGCHETLRDAQAHMAALYASEADKKAEETGPEVVPHQDEMVEGLAEQQEMGLNPRQFTMYDLFETMAEEFGMWDQGVGANGAHYAPADKNPFKEEGLVCSNCVFYEGGKKCEIVSGDIEPEAICKLWIIREELLNTPTMRTQDSAGMKSVEFDEEVKEAGPNGRVIPVHHTDVNMTRPWDKTPPFSRMKSPATPSYYDRIFAYQNPNTKGDRKTHYNFIHHYVDNDGTPGAASWSAISSAMAVLNGGRTGTVLRGEARRGVYNHLVGHYKDAGKEPPELKSDEFVDYVMIQKGIITKPLSEDAGLEVKAAGGPIPSHKTPVRDDERLDRSAILNTRSPEDPSYYKKIFAYQVPGTDGTRKSHYTFIHHHVSEDGQPGAASMSELAAEMAILNGGRGGTILRGQDREAVYNHLARHYRDFGKKPPELKSDEYIDNIMMQKGLIDKPLSIMENTDEQS